MKGLFLNQLANEILLQAVDGHPHYVSAVQLENKNRAITYPGLLHIHKANFLWQSEGKFMTVISIMELQKLKKKFKKKNQTNKKTKKLHVHTMLFEYGWLIGHSCL